MSSISNASNAILALDATSLHKHYPFTEELKFDDTITWADKNHKPMQKACEKAGSNIYSVIVGHHTTKNQPNYWICGTEVGSIVPYNVKQKVGLIRSNRT